MNMHLLLKNDFIDVRQASNGHVEVVLEGGAFMYNLNGSSEYIQAIIDFLQAAVDKSKIVETDKDRLAAVRAEMLRSRTFNKPLDADENWLESEDTETGAISYLPKELLLEHHRLQRKIRGIK